ncbi:OmpH family outer membrane protein [Novosphingobium aquimarinum]|uniref:OmpH family outer membrane protein n=1 Tax=Novosphingobium aquimarinum TaxID=2682494 RepID=UPI0012EB78DC|nr:OmpH family outer membrane protein [Novosphingobium aquimarinum]
MQMLLKTALAAALAAGTALTAQPVLAQATGTVVQGLAIANLDAVIANSNAFKTAETQRQTTYKAQIDQAEQRRNAISAQLNPLVTKFNTDSQAANPNQASLQQQAATIQRMQESGQEELQRILQPVAMSRAYVTEQIEDKLDQAVKAAMGKKKVSLLLNPQAIVAVNASAYNLNQDILTELNTMIPSAQIVPPAGWEPRQIREARAQQAAAAGQAPAPAATTTQPQGR